VAQLCKLRVSPAQVANLRHTFGGHSLPLQKSC
jgi:hypothetical protein